MEAIRHPRCKVVYNNRDITATIMQYIVSLTYTDVVEGESDEIVITLNDSNDVWINEYYPIKGAKLQVEIGYDDEFVNCGVFYIDSVSYSTPPNEFVIRALATSPQNQLRTVKNKRHQGKTLKQIAQAVADSQGLKLMGSIADIYINSKSQTNETDLSFLSRLSKEYGYIFNIKDNLLIFSSLYELQTKGGVKTYDKTQFTRLSFQDESINIVKNAIVKYQNPKKDKLIKENVKKDDKLPNGFAVGGVTEVTSGDTMEVTIRAENEQQAKAKATAFLYRNNSSGQTGNFETYGEPLMVAGNNIDINGLGVMSGRWLITKSIHSITRSGGYTTAITGKRMKDVSEPQLRRSPRKKKKTPPPVVRRSGGGGGGFISYDSPSV